MNILFVHLAKSNTNRKHTLKHYNNKISIANIVKCIIKRCRKRKYRFNSSISLVEVKEIRCLVEITYILICLLDSTIVISVGTTTTMQM